MKAGSLNDNEKKEQKDLPETPLQKEAMPKGQAVSETQVKEDAAGDGAADAVEQQKKEFHIWHLSKKASLLALEICAVVAILLFVTIGGLIWRLQTSPIDVGFAKEYVEQALRNESESLHVQMDDIVLYWPDLKGPLLLGLKNAKLQDEQGNDVLSVEEIAIGFSRRALLVGKIMPKDLLIKKPALRIVRGDDGKFDFGFGSTLEDAKEDEATKAPRRAAVERVMEVLSHPGAEDGAKGPLARLERFRIEDARLHFEDGQNELAIDFPAVNIDMRSTRNGLMAGLMVALNDVDQMRRYPITAQFFLDWKTQQTKAQLKFEDLTYQDLARKIPDLKDRGIEDLTLNGSVLATLDENFMPVQAAVNLDVPLGMVSHEEWSSEPMPLRDLSLKAIYGEEVLKVEDLSATIKDVTFHADGQFRVEKMNGRFGGISGPLHLKIDDIPQSYIGPIWPMALAEENAKHWIVDKLSEGDLSGLMATMNISARHAASQAADVDMMGPPTKDQMLKQHGEPSGWDFDATDLRAEFAFENMTVNYRDPLPPVTKGKGHGVFLLDEETLSITVDDGEMGGMQVSNAQLEFSHIIEGGKGVADLAIPLKGPLVKAFEYISTEPIHLKEKLDMDLAKVKGEAEFTAKLNFPAIADLEMEQLKMDIKGTVKDAVLPNVVKGLPVSGGPFNFEVNNELYKVTGSGKLSNRPVTVEWQEYINSEGKKFKHRAKAQITADEDLRKHFGVDLSDYLEGAVPVDITYTGYRDGSALVQGKGDLSGAIVKFEPLSYIKNAGSAGGVSFKVELKGDEPEELNHLIITAPGLSVDGGRLVFAQSKTLGTYVKVARIERANIGETSGAVDFETEASGRLKVVMKGAFLDLRPFLAGDDEKAKDGAAYDAPPMLLSVSVQEMRTTDTEKVRSGKIYADIDGEGRFNQLELDAVAGGGDVYLRYKPDEKGARTFRLEADNAGAALKAFGVYDQMVGGKLNVYAEPIDNVYDRNLVGTVEISDFKVVGAPVLARLFGAMSLTGVVQLLDGEGVSFSKLEAGIDWLYRPQGGLLVLKDGRTSGNSLGLTFDGVFDNTAQKIDVSGTIIPLSGINSVVTSIPLIGDILSGGSSAVFAATYSIKGSSQEPDVSVNPLAALTPGILRRILFE